MSIRSRFFAALAVVFFASNSIAAECPSTISSGTVLCDVITQYGITWTLAASESVGQFANGDYYIIDDGNVTVSAVSPPTSGTGETLVNGSMVNPTVYAYGAVTQGGQGLDGAANNYRPELTATFPLILAAGDVLVSSIGITSETVRWDGVAGKDSHDELASVAYLTVVGSAKSDYSPSRHAESCQYRPYTRIRVTTKNLARWKIRWDRGVRIPPQYYCGRPHYSFRATPSQRVQ